MGSAIIDLCLILPVEWRPMKTSKQFFMVFALATLSGVAQAEWVEIEKFEDGMRIYVDRTSAQRDGDFAEVLHLVRWGEAQTGEEHPPYLSTVVRTTYHCVDKLEKYQSSVSYAGAMGNGAKVLSDEQDEVRWYTISDASMEEKLWKIACAVF